MHCGANVSIIRQKVDMFLVLASGIRVPGTNFALKVAKNIEFLKMFHPKELFLPFYKKKNFKNLPLEHGTQTIKMLLLLYINTSRRFSCSKFVPTLGTNVKNPIKSTFFDFLKKSKMIKKVTIDVKLFNNTNDYLQF
jgi:hypothetical protein